MNLLQELKEAKSVGIAGHIRPDGDCAGSSLALYHYLRQALPEEVIIDLYLEPISDKFYITDDVSKIKQNNEENLNYDVFIALDSGSLDRLGFAAKYFEKAEKTINIDHHISNTRFAKVNHVLDDASSTCEVLYDLFEEVKIDAVTAKALYLGIIHDTGVFKHSNTTEKTMKIAGKLITKGIPFSEMIDDTFYRKNYRQNQILGRCLLESILLLQGKCIVSSVSKRMIEFYDAVTADLDGIIDQLRITEGVEVAILIYESDFHEHKVSMRSNGIVDVSKIATYFGGGGHIKAAGCTMRGTLHDVVNNLTPHIEHQLKHNTSE
ncbi:1-pyrroline-5-carboxylate dehydrogenase [Anaerocolumna cellulosilytica]|uniref:1-pyrroline-5-carboxylate dehydrogenase n=1 Tax=Anaerocolumna cellulosilytica TaxID=433286 RepID=A0A6S6QVA6_9FIRM|nr:bifunctional oligoribonuclease/PAP phosphatase NrnA [Anaerocolumna cellulosilytica]MBB5198042.1 phosphoesterase RecJ-like protein [Anaerocolumna cellulosilytica]BCJ95183.1 1-pyrroline-5-carboxylate dehydrogenase [Anaerocolumna cellulosilytica]